MNKLNNYVVIDIETNGLYPLDGCQILAVSALKVFNNKIQDHFFSLLDVNRNLDPLVLELTGINKEDLKDAPNAEIVLPQLVEFIAENPIVCHNADFVEKFLEHELYLQKIRLFSSFHCTLLQARKFFPNQNNTLDELIKRLGLQSMRLESGYALDEMNVYQIY